MSTILYLVRLLADVLLLASDDCFCWADSAQTTVRDETDTKSTFRYAGAWIEASLK